MSAFALETEGDMMQDETMIQADELAKARTEQLADREVLTEKFLPLSLDSSAVKYFFTSLRGVSGDDESFWQSIELMVEIINNEYEQSEGEKLKLLMCIRGLIILTMNE